MQIIHRLEVRDLPIGEDLSKDFARVVHVINYRPQDRRLRAVVEVLEIKDIMGGSEEE